MLPNIPNIFLFGLLIMGLMASIALFISLKYEVRVQARKDQARLDAMLKRLEEAERPAPVPDPEPEVAEPIIALRSGLNMNKRVQAVRLLRRGEDIGHVAAALGVTRREVELLVRVQKISAQRASAAGAGR